MAHMKQRLLLAGGGHAQLSVLRALSMQDTDIETILVTPSPFQIYSGMLPGWMTGLYTLDECRIDLRPLAAAAKVRLLAGQVAAIHAGQRSVTLADGAQLGYDALSLDVGSDIDTSLLQAAGDRLFPVKPLAEFIRRWPRIIEDAAQTKGYRLAVVGGGAAGVELAFAAQHAFATRGHDATVVLVSSAQGLLPGHAEGVKRRVGRLMQQRGIANYRAQAVADGQGLQLATGEHIAVDCIIGATGARAPDWLDETDLARDERGYILVDAHHRSLSHPQVFAAGDVCARNDMALARSGVHAVFAGPVLAHNLLASLSGQELHTYHPRKRSLYILATGSKHAIASWGAFSAQGGWVWQWKNWIDRRFMRKHGVRDTGQT